jgi:hypothetical protein
VSVLTPQLFHAAVDDVWAKAQTDFANSHFVYGHLIGVSREVSMCNLAQAGTDEERSLLQGRGITPVPPGSWQDSAGLIAATLARNNSVAAIWLGEAWTVSDLAAAETIVRGTRAGDHPMRDEMVYVYATWPRARLQRAHFARINRGKKGGDTPVLEPVPDDHPMHADRQAGTQVFLFGWLDDLLPQPPTQAKP